MDESAERGEGTVIRTDNDRSERHDAQDPQRRQHPFRMPKLPRSPCYGIFQSLVLHDIHRD